MLVNNQQPKKGDTAANKNDIPEDAWASYVHSSQATDGHSVLSRGSPTTSPNYYAHALH